MIQTRALAPPRWSDPGDLSEVIAIRTFSATADGYGGETRAWSTLDTVWAHVRPWLGGERNDDGAVRAVREYRVRIWRRTDIAPRMRLVWGEIEMTIVDVPQVPAHEMLMELRCMVGEVD